MGLLYVKDMTLELIATIKYTLSVPNYLSTLKNNCPKLDDMFLNWSNKELLLKIQSYMERNTSNCTRFQIWIHSKLQRSYQCKNMKIENWKWNWIPITQPNQTIKFFTTKSILERKIAHWITSTNLDEFFSAMIWIIMHLDSNM